MGARRLAECQGCDTRLSTDSARRIARRVVARGPHLLEVSPLVMEVHAPLSPCTCEKIRCVACSAATAVLYDASPPAPAMGEKMAVDSWTEQSFNCRGREFRMFAQGDGPPVIVLHELMGAGEKLFGFAEHLVRRGYGAYVPVFYGQPYRDVSPLGGLVRNRICLWRELHLFSTGRTSPLVHCLRGLVDDVSDEGRKPVGVVGMCMTGGLVLGLLAHGGVAAGVAAQPSLPVVIPLPKWRESMARSLGMSAQDVAAAAVSSTPLMVLRYRKDRLSPPQRFNRIIDEFGSTCEQESDSGGMHVRRCGRVTAIELEGDEHATLTHDAMPDAVAAATQFLEQHLPVRGEQASPE